jgi:glycerate dehydrogenase
VLGSAVLRQLPRLKYVGVMATGYNVVDVGEAKRLAIIVTNVPAYSSDSVAQMVFAHLLNVTNRTDHYAEQNRKGEWSQAPDFCYADTPLIELAGKTMGVVALGNIGKKVAQIALAFGMKVVAATGKAQKLLPHGVKKVSLDQLFAASDVVSLHCPLTEKTFHMVDNDRIALMKPSAILINTARGPLVDERAVAQALNDNRLAAYCADVLETEPPQTDNALLLYERVFITPHVAWASLEARKRLLQVVTDNVEAFINGCPVNVVNK